MIWIFMIIGTSAGLALVVKGTLDYDQTPILDRAIKANNKKATRTAKSGVVMMWFSIFAGIVSTCLN